MSIMELLINLILNSQTNIMRIVWRTVRRITNEILGVEGLSMKRHQTVTIISGSFSNLLSFH